MRWHDNQSLVIRYLQVCSHPVELIRDLNNQTVLSTDVLMAEWQQD